MTLIDNWPRCWRLTSVQAALVLVLLNIATVAQEQLLPLFGFAIPPHILPWVNAVLGLAVIVLRAIAQPGALDPKPPEGPTS